jgi:hypothetical protein
MSPESASWCKLTQPVTNHILCDVDRHMAATIVHSNGMPHQLGEYHTGPTPGSDNFFLSAFIHRFDLLQ